MPEENTMKKVFKYTPEGKRSLRRASKRWLDSAENDLMKMGVRGWRKIAKDRDAWKLILKLARALHHGSYSQWRELVSEEDMCLGLLRGDLKLKVK
jgi:hypothetical protein